MEQPVHSIPSGEKDEQLQMDEQKSPESSSGHSGCAAGLSERCFPSAEVWSENGENFLC